MYELLANPSAGNRMSLANRSAGDRIPIGNRGSSAGSADFVGIRVGKKINSMRRYHITQEYRAWARDERGVSNVAEWGGGGTLRWGS